VDQIFGYPKKKLIQMRLDLENGTIPTNKIDGFKERIEAMLPTLIEHRCSEGCRGIFSRVERGWMGHVIEHIALEIQTLAGMDTVWENSRDQNTGTYNVVFIEETLAFRRRISRCDRRILNRN
jgi:cyanophycin synthetase